LNIDVVPGGAGKAKLYQQVANAVARRIRAGTYRAGERIPSERELAEEFSVSRPTVREAMIALEVLGLVQSRHGSGIYAADEIPEKAAEQDVELDVGEFELTEARMLFEGEAAALAALTISDDELDELERLVEAIAEENAQDEGRERADRAFHIAIARATRNSLILEVVERLWDIRDSSPLCVNMLERARSRGSRPRVDEHAAILSALRARDAKAAREAMRHHLSQVVEALLQYTEMQALERAKAEAVAKRREMERLTSL
jgi:GntR family transcriptional repressor for pyruvate dehydrogenase complex